MIQRALDENGDWVFGKGKNSFVTGLDAVLLSIKTRVSCWKGSWFADPNFGVDYNNLLGHGRQKALELELKKTIFTTEGVKSIVSFSLDVDEEDPRVFKMRVVVDTIYGQGEV